jgi:membrane protease YdiL (CAAX protease family)
MLDLDWAFTPPILWLALAGLLAFLVLRSVRKDRREYQRFKRYRTTARRQAMFRKWLGESFFSFGGLSIGLLLLAGAYVAPLLRELQAWPVLRDIRGTVAHDPLITAAAIGAGLIVIVVLTALGVRALRHDKESVTTIGDIAAMLPRNRDELLLGGLLSINAGIVEELLFRFALPALVFGATGSAGAAVLFSVVLFGALHLYQGPAGIVGTTVIGALMLAIYVISGTIVLPMALHALFDLRSLVIIPMAVSGVHRIGARPAVPTN